MPDTSLGLPPGRWRERALVLNFQPAEYIHPSWLEDRPFAELLEPLRGAPRARSLLSRHLLEALALEGEWVEDFSNPWARLALLEGAWLERLLHRLGIALCSPSLRRELSGPRLRELHQALSADDWSFLTRETPLLGAIPDFLFEPRYNEPGCGFGSAGLHYCATRGLAGAKPALLRRLSLKLPSAWSSRLPVSQASDESALPPILRRLLRELPPAWSPLFA